MFNTKLTPLQIESLFNECLKSFNEESTDDSGLRNQIFEHLKKTFRDIHLVTWTGTEFSTAVGDFGMVFKISIKKTDRIEQITRLKSAYVKRANRIKLASIDRNVLLPCFKWKGTELVLNKDSTVYHSGIQIKSFKTPICEMNIQFLLEAFHESTGKELKEEIMTHIRGEYFKSVMFNHGEPSKMLTDQLNKIYSESERTKDYYKFDEAIREFCNEKYSSLCESLYPYCFQ